MTAGHLYELLKPAAGTEVIGAWSNRFASGVAAITARQVGEGTVIYVGTYLTADLVAHLAPGVLSRADVHPLLPDLPEGVEVTIRQAADRQLLFVLNTREQPIRVRGVPDGLDLLTGTPVESHAVHLGEYGCSIIQMRHAT
jgi:beta-galactosidase